jgi:hypothetical protein
VSNLAGWEQASRNVLTRIMSKDHDALKEYKIGETGDADCLEGARIPDVLWPMFFSLGAMR